MDGNGPHDVLRAAIDSLLERKTDADFKANYFSWEAGRMALVFWSDALVRDIDHLHELLAQSREAIDALEDGTLPLEDAFFRIDAACEKIRALLALCLGVHAVVEENNKLFFRPGRVWDKVQQRLRELGQTDAYVRRLAVVYGELSAATTYRNQVSHSLSAISNTYLAPFVQVNLDADLRQLPTEHRYLAPEGVFRGGDIRAETLIGIALETAESAALALEEATRLVAQVTREHGVLDCGPRIYCVYDDDGTGVYSMNDPRTRPATAGEGRSS